MGDTYITLSQEEQDKITIDFYRGQERDAFCHRLNLQRYTAMLNSGISGDWRQRVLALKTETEKRLAEVVSIMDATKPQLPSQEVINKYMSEAG